jgi:alkylation response protein AidB-like acyl-CoA dehydrogenase
MATAVPVEPPARAAEGAVLRLVLPELRRFLGREVDARAIDREGSIPPAVRAGLARLGLFGITIPAEYGGAGLSLASACRVVAEIAKVDRSLAILVGLHAGLGTRGLVELGSAELRARWLPRLAAGECIASFAATEAGAGSALGEIRTTGRLVDGAVRLDGEKSYVTNGGFAGLFTVLARTPGLGGERGHSLVCVPADAPGVAIGAEEDKLGIRGSSTVTVTFDGVRVPLEDVLGTPGKGVEHAHALLAWGRTLMSAGCVGAAQAAVESTVAHVLRRQQFGRPVGEFAASRAHVAWMAARACAMEALVRSVGEELAAGGAIDLSSTVAKVFCSEGAFEVCDRAVQLHGALGFLEDTGLPRLLRDTRITRIFEGANDVLLVRLGTAVLGGFDAMPARPLTIGVIPQSEQQPIEALERELGIATAGIREQFGVAAVRRQLTLQRLARALVCLRAAWAVIEQASPADALVARYAVEVLGQEASSWLALVGRAGTDEHAAWEVTDRIYASEGRR